jgi:hypothetical protein
MIFEEAQRDIRRAYVGGGPGVIVSAIVWFAAAYAEHSRDVRTAFIVLFLGGMLIFPTAMLLARTLFRRAKEVQGNPLGTTGLESTIAMMGGLFAAWLFLPMATRLVLPVAAIAVGTHYAVFKTVYGDRLFWLLGGIVTALGMIDIAVAPLPGGIALCVAVVELTFGVVLTIRATRAQGGSIATAASPAR